MSSESCLKNEAMVLDAMLRGGSECEGIERRRIGCIDGAVCVVRGYGYGAPQHLLSFPSDTKMARQGIDSIFFVK